MRMTEFLGRQMVGLNRVEFWSGLDELISSSQLIIDRPKGSRHPRFPEFVYPLDYGYLAETTSGDGDGIDVWIGSRSNRILDAVALTVDLKKRDAEIKLLLGCTEQEKRLVLDFLNNEFMQALLVPRENPVMRMIETRQSIRRFHQRPVPSEIVERLLNVAVQAPSAHNRQPWRFVVLESDEAKERLAERMGVDFRRDLLADGLSEEEAEQQVQRSRQRLQQAPLVLVLCLDPTLGDRYPDPTRQQAEYLMGVQSVALAGENLLLAAHAEGLGGVWVCSPLFAPQAVREALDLPPSWQPQGLLLIGYPAKIPTRRSRRPISEVTSFR